MMDVIVIVLLVISLLSPALSVSATTSNHSFPPEDVPIKSCRRNSDCGSWGFCVGRTMPFDHVAFCRCSHGTKWTKGATNVWHCEPAITKLLRSQRSSVPVKPKEERPLTMSRWFPHRRGRVASISREASNERRLLGYVAFCGLSNCGLNFAVGTRWVAAATTMPACLSVSASVFWDWADGPQFAPSWIYPPPSAIARSDRSTTGSAHPVLTAPQHV
uniref:Secreted protein n=1 Tax=Plectus sambesii TaxID=2011161 RepID=A0A914WMM1_9BILA